jgi:hypothetical protein
VPIPPGFVFQSNESISADQRLSAFGALTLGMKALIKINDKQLLQVSLNWYEQRTAWHWITKGSRGIEPLQSRFFNIQHSVSF